MVVDEYIETLGCKVLNDEHETREQAVVGQVRVALSVVETRRRRNLQPKPSCERLSGTSWFAT